MYRIPLQRGSQQPLDRDSMAQLSEEISEIWSFMQRYIDEQSVDMVLSLRDEVVPLTKKMDLMDWLARNAEFFSPESIQRCLNAFRDLYSQEDISLRNSFIKANHASRAVLTVGNLITHV